MIKIFAIFLLIFLIGCTKNFEDNFSQISIDNGKKSIKINVEIADDKEEKGRGLMFRKSLDEKSGMFFIFDDESYQKFWMKNMLIPLDIIFIGKDFEIVDIKYAIPCEKESCALYESSKPAKYVMEVNGNFTMKNNLKIGDEIKIPKLYK